MRRPFGTSTLLAAYDDAGPQLYLIEPSGNCHVRRLQHATLSKRPCVIPEHDMVLGKFVLNSRQRLQQGI